MPESNDIQVAIFDGFSEIFGESEIQRVHVKRSHGYDGDPVLYIYVITNWEEPQVAFKNGRLLAKGIDESKFVEVRRHLRETLEALGEHALPVVSYIARDDEESIENAL